MSWIYHHLKKFHSHAYSKDPFMTLLYELFGPFLKFVIHMKKGNVDSDSKWIRQKFFKNFITKKFKNRFYFFTCILPDYVSNDSPKEFKKNKHFENMRAVFHLRCQNPLRWEIRLICHWNIDSWKQNLSFG